MRVCVLSLGLAFTPLLASAQSAPDPAPSSADAVIREYARECDAAGRGLWKVSLCAPIVVVSPEGKVVLTSEPAPSAPLPSTRANTSVDWGGRKWVMVLSPLPANPHAVRQLVYHESFHVHQQALGLPDNMAVAAHLESEDARYWLRMEWKALEHALQSTGDARKQHVEQALAFRKQRLSSADALRDERLQMRHEGLAEYTGVALSKAPQAQALDNLQHGNDRPSFSRSFAYVSGPAWGLVLDALAPDWKAMLLAKPDADLPDLVPLKPAGKLDMQAYGGDALRIEEHARAVKRQAVLDAATKQTSEANGLRLPLAKIQLDFDPNRVYPMPDGSSVYDKITLTSDWGALQSDGVPVRIAQDWSAVFVPWPTPQGMALTLSKGWSAKRDDAGRTRVVRDAPAP